jgi:hypothetical protein
MAELPERLRLDLADPLAGDLELIADLLQRPGTAVLQYDWTLLPAGSARRGPSSCGQAGEPRAAPGQRDPQERRGFLRGGARPPVLEVTRYIDEQRGSFGVEPICQALAIAPSSYYAARVRPPSARAVRDEALGA